jgi:hypothetical protein
MLIIIKLLFDVLKFADDPWMVALLKDQNVLFNNSFLHMRIKTFFDACLHTGFVLDKSKVPGLHEAVLKRRGVMGGHLRARPNHLLCAILAQVIPAFAADGPHSYFDLRGK